MKKSHFEARCCLARVVEFYRLLVSTEKNDITQLKKTTINKQQVIGLDKYTVILERESSSKKSFSKYQVCDLDPRYHGNKAIFLQTAAKQQIPTSHQLKRCDRIIK